MNTKLKGNYHSMTFDEKGNTYLTFVFPPGARHAACKAVEEIKQSINKGKEWFSIKIATWRNNRTLNANAYAWLLMGKIAELLRMDKDEIYLMMLQRYGVFTHIIVNPAAVERTMQEWRTSKILGEVTVNGRTGIQIQCYFGSSGYDTKEMSVLIDGIVSECEQMGIETITPSELALLKGEWGSAKMPSVREAG